VNISLVPHCVSKAVFMVQHEVAMRLVATAGSEDYGLLSVLVQKTFSPSYLFKVANTAFYPRPKVDSAVVMLVPHAVKHLDKEHSQQFMRVAKIALQARRKTLLNNLCGGLGKDKETIRGIIQILSWDEKRRAETLSVEEFEKLSDTLRQHNLL